ncbi:beta-eliminating lyase-related protein [Blastopirellula sp. J2-11]|uniref:threonine aldolase family protein n=1 Tax=Blastopirellula sp. J2-11 TaxID=2943192 RepID=UPI0021C6DA4E|nr:GntG family PLP-dependent aldolase [Blastopirellula sp. J2-11]UUO08569.1 beta-eliminating lyase-related protein [Blastopirellula sp. J2-11]
MIDLRSDTVTQPTTAMRQAMANAEVGDAVIDVDPTVDRLERLTAELLGKEAAVYMPSGSMTNQIAIRIHCKPGDEFLCEVGCHVYNYEQAAFAQLSGVATHTLEGEYGVLKPEQFHDGLVRPENDHMVRTRLVCLENTHNRGAGKVQPYEDVEKICRWAHAAGLQTHLDGARLFNAVAATGVSLADWGKHFDTVSVCFSKGLGAPVGSCLAGPADMMREARRHRKLFGGGMRQAGIIAAGALYGLQHNRERLTEDHEHAQILAAAIQQAAGLSLTPETVDTNIVIFRVDPKIATAAEFVSQLKEAGVAMMAISAQAVRAVTHLDVRRQQIEEAAATLKKLGS